MNIAILDTQNFYDFPIGGQLTSIFYFLRYVSEVQDTFNNFILIGITTDKNDKLGEEKILLINNKEIRFIPVAYIEKDQKDPKTSFRKAFLMGLVKFRKIIKKKKIDIFYIQSYEAFYPVFFLIKHEKIVFFSHGNFIDLNNFIRFNNSNLVKCILKKGIQFVLRFSNYILVLDNKTKNDYLLYNKNVIKVSNSIDTSLYKKTSIKANKEKVQIIFVGRLSKVKNIEEIILSFKILDKSRYNLNIIGEGEENDNLNKLITENNLEEHVHLLGSKNKIELKKLYENSDILILNSYSEGFPMVLLEALSSSIPIISTNVGCINEILVEGYNGEFTDSTAKNIAKKINKIACKLDSYSINAEKSVEKFSYKTINSEIYNLLFREM